MAYTVGQRFSSETIAWAMLLALACEPSREDRSTPEDEVKPHSPRRRAPITSDEPKAEEGEESGTRVTNEPDQQAPKPPPAPRPPVTDPTQQTYPELAQKIPEGCAEPSVIMATAPRTAGEDYPWTWARQALLANLEFQVVDGAPATAGQVSFDLHLATEKYNGAWVLVARCKDGGTCNKLAAMYKAIAVGALASPICGKLPMDLGPATLKHPVLRKDTFGKEALPDTTDVLGQCARLQACTVAMDPANKSGKVTLGFDCQRAPADFQIGCAAKSPCAEVLKCLGP
jgi:hypothetical protein